MGRPEQPKDTGRDTPGPRSCPVTARKKRKKNQKNIVRYSAKGRQTLSLTVQCVMFNLSLFHPLPLHPPLLNIWAATTQYLSQIIKPGHSTEGNLQVRGSSYKIPVLVSPMCPTVVLTDRETRPISSISKTYMKGTG